MGRKNRKIQKTSGTPAILSPCKVLSCADMAKERVSASGECTVSVHLGFLNHFLVKITLN